MYMRPSAAFVRPRFGGEGEGKRHRSGAPPRCSRAARSRLCGPFRAAAVFSGFALERCPRPALPRGETNRTRQRLCRVNRWRFLCNISRAPRPAGCSLAALRAAAGEERVPARILYFRTGGFADAFVQGTSILYQKIGILCFAGVSCTRKNVRSAADIDGWANGGYNKDTIGPGEGASAAARANPRKTVLAARAQPCKIVPAAAIGKTVKICRLHCARGHTRQLPPPARSLVKPFSLPVRIRVKPFRRPSFFQDGY